MTFALSISDAEASRLTGQLESVFDSMREPVHKAMATELFDIVHANFGDFGIDRPWTWPPLVPWYAKQVGRKHATLYVTGKLKNSVVMDATEQSGIVSVSDADCDYATRHQFGSPEENLPSRPFFPIETNNELTEYSFGRVMDAAVDEIERRLK